jgi:carbonic anhydrase
MDARLVVERILDLRPGDAHVLRNAGGTVTDDVLRSLVVSQRLLGTREVMLVHHTDCGMTRIDPTAMLDEMEREVGQRPPFPLLAFADVAQDLRASMERVRTCPFLLHRGRVRGFIFDVAGGGLTELEPAA